MKDLTKKIISSQAWAMPATASSARSSALFLLLAFSSIARGELAVSGYFGFGSGQFKDEGTYSLRVLPVSGKFEYLTALNDFFALSLGISQHRWEVSYKRNAINYQGTYTGMGAGASAIIRMGTTYQLHVGAESISDGVLAAKAITSATINNTTFRHSTLATYTGSSGLLTRVSLIKEKTDEQFSPDERLRIGLSLDVLQQVFDQRAINIATNDSSKAPSASDITKGTYTAFMGCISLVLGFVF